MKIAEAPLLHVEVLIRNSIIERVHLAPSSEKEGFFISSSEKPSSELLAWLHAYAKKKQPPHPLPFGFELTPFIKAVLDALEKIPFGKVASYQEIARTIGRPQACRAVGNACRANPFPLFFPCHRVVSSGGKLGGFAYGPALKKLLLDFEET